jgi:hypothetical protein
MRNAIKSNLSTPVRNLGRWRPIADLKKDKTLVLVCGPQFGPNGNGHAIMRACDAEVAGAQYWQPLDPTPAPSSQERHTP